MRFRIRFAKKGNIRFIGHLDMLRYFQKAIRRAKLPIKYSEGFHPHQILSFAMPLGVGVESEGDYLDLELLDQEVQREMNGASEVSEAYLQELVDRLNLEMAEGVTILSVKLVPDKSRNAMAAVSAAEYLVWFPEHTLTFLESRGIFREELQKSADRFYHESTSIMVTKKTKKSEREIDLKPLIHAFATADAPEGETGGVALSMLLSAGSENNVKPDLVMQAFLATQPLSPEEKEEAEYRILRKELYETGEDGRFVPLG